MMAMIGPVMLAHAEASWSVCRIRVNAVILNNSSLTSVVKRVFSRRDVNTSCRGRDTGDGTARPEYPSFADGEMPPFYYVYPMHMDTQRPGILRYATIITINGESCRLKD
jgi:hypothetical protein